MKQHVQRFQQAKQRLFQMGYRFEAVYNYDIEVDLAFERWRVLPPYDGAAAREHSYHDIIGMADSLIPNEPEFLFAQAMSNVVAGGAVPRPIILLDPAKWAGVVDSRMMNLIQMARWHVAHDIKRTSLEDSMLRTIATLAERLAFELNTDLMSADDYANGIR